MNCKSLQAEIEKEVFEVQIKNVNKQLTEYTTDQINHTIALYIMKKCCEDGKMALVNCELFEMYLETFRI